MSTTLSTIAELRAHLAQIAPVRVQSPPTATGHPLLDTHLGGWPHPGVASIHGAVGTGRIGLILPALQAHTQAKRTVAIVDPLGWLHPPGLPGVNLKHLMLVRCGGFQSRLGCHSTRWLRSHPNGGFTRPSPPCSRWSTTAPRDGGRAQHCDSPQRTIGPTTFSQYPAPNAWASPHSDRTRSPRFAHRRNSSVDHTLLLGYMMTSRGVHYVCLPALFTRLR